MIDDQTNRRRFPLVRFSRRARTAVGAARLSLALLGGIGISAGVGVWSVGAASPSVAAATNNAPVGHTADATTSGPVSVPLAQVTNLTPYTWKLYHNDFPRKGVAPPDTLQPGQTGSWDATGYPWPTYTGWIYLFTDAHGGLHQVDLDSNTDGNFYTKALDIVNGQAVASTVFHLQGESDGGRHVDAVWNSPITVTIDGNKDQASAAAAVTYELPRAIPSSVTFQPLGQPTFAWGTPSRATSMVYNFSSAPVTVVKGQETTKGQSTSLGLELSASVSVNVMGIAAKTAYTVTGDHEWGSSDTVGVDVDTDVEPGHVGWIDKRVSTAYLTGNLTFTTPEGITFFVDNVTVSKGDMIDPNTAPGLPQVGMDFTPQQCSALPGDTPAAVEPSCPS
jgi:hypothetical protein